MAAYVDLEEVSRELLADPPTGGKRDRSWRRRLNHLAGRHKVHHLTHIDILTPLPYS